MILNILENRMTHKCSLPACLLNMTSDDSPSLCRVDCSSSETEYCTHVITCVITVQKVTCFRCINRLIPIPWDALNLYHVQVM